MTSRLIFSTVLALGCAVSATTHAQSRDSTGAESLQIALDLADQPGPGAIDYLTPFRVVITNAGKQPIRIWNPCELPGRNQWTLQFKSQDAEKPILVRYRDFKDEQKSSRADIGEEEIGEVLTLEPGRKFYLNVSLSAATGSPNEYARQLDWQGLPDPAAPGDFQFSMTLESPASAEAAANQLWTGRVTTPEIKTQIFAHRLMTPHRLLRYHFPDAAFEMLKQNPAKWISYRDDEYRMPLHLAVIYGNAEMVEWLIKNGAAETTFGVNDFKPLEFAQRPEMVKALLKTKLDLKNATGEGLLQNAAEGVAKSQSDEKRKQQLEIVKLLRGAGAKESVETAIYLNDLDAVKGFIKSYPQESQDWTPESALRVAVKQGRLEICKSLLEIPDIDVNDFEGGSGYPILVGALKYPAIARLLIERKANLRKAITWTGGRSGQWIVKNNATLLHYAAQDGLPETIKLLIDNGVDIFAPARDSEVGEELSQTALEVAAIAGQGDNALAIIEHPKFKLAPDLVRWAALNDCLIGLSGSTAAHDGDRRKWFTTLAAAGADIRRLGISAVQNAAAGMHPGDEKENSRRKETIAILRELGAEVDLPSAVLAGDEKLVAELLAKSPQLVNNLSPQGIPPLHAATKMNYPKIVALLLASGGDVDVRHQAENTLTEGGTALDWAAFWGRVTIARLLIEKGANVNALDSGGRTPLFNAARMKNLKIARLLLENGAKIDLKDKEGATPADWAENNKQVADLFDEFKTPPPQGLSP